MAGASSLDFLFHLLGGELDGHTDLRTILGFLMGFVLAAVVVAAAGMLVSQRSFMGRAVYIQINGILS